MISDFANTEPDTRARRLEGDALREAFAHEQSESAMDDKAYRWLVRLIILATCAAALGVCVGVLFMVGRG